MLSDNIWKKSRNHKNKSFYPHAVSTGEAPDLAQRNVWSAGSMGPTSWKLYFSLYFYTQESNFNSSTLH